MSTGRTAWTIMWLRINWFLIDRLSVYDRFYVNWLNVDWFRINWLNVDWWSVVTTTSISTKGTAFETPVRGSFQPGVSIKLVAPGYMHLQIVWYFCSSCKQKRQHIIGVRNFRPKLTSWTSCSLDAYSLLVLLETWNFTTLFTKACILVLGDINTFLTQVTSLFCLRTYM
jgi:hypothetical protein